MRTTLTLEDDVAVGIERLRRTHGLTLKAAVNEAIRRGLRTIGEEAGEDDPYRIEPWAAGRLLIDNVDDVAETLAVIEDEAFK